MIFLTIHQKHIAKKIIFFFLFFLCIAFVNAQDNSNEQLAIQYFQNKEYEKAAELFEDLFNKNPSPFYYNYYFNTLLELKDYKKAEKFVSKQSKKDPENYTYTVDLGYIYQLSGDIDKSKKHFDNIIKNVYPHKDVIIKLADAFLLRNLDDYAIRTYEQGKKILKNYYNFNLELAEVYLKKNEFGLALEQYLDYLESFPNALENIQAKLQDLLLNDPDGSKGEVFKTKLLTRIKKNPELIAYPQMLLWYFIQQKEFSAAFIQAKAIDKRFNEDGTRIVNLAKVASSNGFYDDAIACYDYIINEKGIFSVYYQQALVDRLNTKYLKITQTPNINPQEITSLENEFLDLISKSGKTNYALQLIKNLAHLQAFYMNKTEQAVKMLQEALTYPSISAEILAQCKIELADILILTGDPWEASLLYMQVEKAFKNDVIGFEAKFKNAKLYFYIGEFEFAKAQLDILKAATAKFIANDAMELSLLIGNNYDEDSTTYGLSYYAKADLLMFQNKYDEALKTLDSINMLGLYHPLFDDVLLKKAQIKIKQGKYADADTLLVKLINFYSDEILVDDAMFLLAEINEKYLNNKERAMEFYLKIVTDYSGSIYAVDARRRYRALRGDKIN